MDENGLLSAAEDFTRNLGKYLEEVYAGRVRVTTALDVLDAFTAEFAAMGDSVAPIVDFCLTARQALQRMAS